MSPISININYRRGAISFDRNIASFSGEIFKSRDWKYRMKISIDNYKTYLQKLKSQSEG